MRGHPKFMYEALIWTTPNQIALNHNVRSVLLWDTEQRIVLIPY